MNLVNCRFYESVRFLAISVLLVLSTFAFAHHPVASQYETGQKFTIEGILKRVEIGSPHSFLHIDVVDEHGNEQAIRVEWGSAASLTRLYSISRSSIQLDQKIRVSGFLSKNKDDSMIWPMSIHTEFDLEYDRIHCNRIEKAGQRCTVLTDTPPLWPLNPEIQI